jgi:hypothetical protein
MEGSGSVLIITDSDPVKLTDPPSDPETGFFTIFKRNKKE